MAHAPHAVAHAGEHEHGGEKLYIKVASILAVITAIEVAIYYVKWAHVSGVLVPALMVMSIFKFGAVIAYFMHLKMDSKLLTWVFLGGLFLAMFIVLALFILLRVHGIDYATDLIVVPE